MSAPHDVPTFFVSPPHTCGYLEGREAVTLFLDPARRPTRPLYAHLARHGFRRSGEHLYRPRCPGCSACVPVRVPVDVFQPNRSQRRCLAGNRDLHLERRPFAFDEAQFELYRRYMAWRHPGSSMDDPEPDHYLACFASSWGETETFSWYAEERLVSVAIVDLLEDGFSAVYTMFDPCAARRGPGNFAVLRQVELARDAGLDWVYLGYWIGASPKMAYKIGFRPLEWYGDGRWHRLDPGAPVPS
ncbi:MAG: arginyltransferase [Gammaproteobacteria bacterium]|nr:arginyltransferase [Gammaproteobacteria bacterium]